MKSNNFKKNLVYIVLLLVLGIFIGISTSYASDKAVTSHYNSTTALDIVKNPNKYLNTNVKMTVTFDKFSALGLDYPSALRDSEKYIGFTIQRDDVKDHNVPLSEMKLFLKREYAEKFAELDTGDKIEIQGKVFSTALNDPWIDVETIVIKDKKVKETK